PVHLQGHLLRQVALGNRHDDPGDLRGRPAQVVDERVDRTYALDPRALELLLVDTLGQPPLPADDAADAQQLPVAQFLELDDLVEPVAHLTGKSRPAPQPGLEVPRADPAERRGQLFEQTGVVRRILDDPRLVNGAHRTRSLISLIRSLIGRSSWELVGAGRALQ